ncbi:hypothetical protein SUDANB95_04697 [Actinosynnema sp. ALI-1.44]
MKPHDSGFTRNRPCHHRGVERSEATWSPAVLFEPSGSRLLCTLCPTGCSLADGQVGACKVRRRGGDTGETATRATSVRHLDPVERKPFYHVRPGAPTVTLAAPGCTFRCDYCVNHRISQYGRDHDTWSATPVDAPEIARDAITRDAFVALSYSEPSLAAELTLDLAAQGARILWKSNGFLTPQAADLLAPALTAVNIDVKGTDDTRHHKLTGAPVTPVLDTIRTLHAKNVWLEISTPLIPGICDSPQDLAAIAEFIAAIDPAIPWHLLRFTPTYRRTQDNPTTPSALAEARAIGHKAGLHHVYVERALGEEGRNTHCPTCRTPVIQRTIWGLTRNDLSDGTCPHCATTIQGIWR